MAEKPSSPQDAFLQRIDRRLRFLKSLQDCRLPVFLPPNEQQRKESIDKMVRAAARQSEIAHLDPATLAKATEAVRAQLEAMQAQLPHDVQYRNRIKRDW